MSHGQKPRSRYPHFAAWRWPRRKQLAFVVVAIMAFPVAYILSAAPMFYLLEWRGMRPSEVSLYNRFYEPLNWCDPIVPTHQIFAEEYLLLVRILGEPVP
jgi:hypothetical protein